MQKLEMNKGKNKNKNKEKIKIKNKKEIKKKGLKNFNTFFFIFTI